MKKKAKVIALLSSIAMLVIIVPLYQYIKWHSEHNSLIEDPIKHVRQLIIDKQLSEDSKRGILFRSLGFGDVETAKLILKDTHLDPNAPGDIAFLFSAVIADENRVQLLSLLMESGLNNIDINLKESREANTLLHEAAIKDCADSAEYLIQKGIDVDAKNSNDETPLHVCAIIGSCEMTKVLLEHGADVYAKDKKGRTPLMLALEPPGFDGASASGKRKMVALLREYMEKSK